MTVYLDLAGLLNFLVDYLLLLGADRITGSTAGWKQLLPGAVLGGIYGAVCLIPGFSFLSGVFWKTVVLFLICILAFGFHRSAIRRSVLFCLLSFALGGVAVSAGKPGCSGLLLSVGGILLLCRMGFRMGDGVQRRIPCRLTHRGKTVQAIALVDTGNTLRDPISGQQVLVGDRNLAKRLLGIGVDLLLDPVTAVSCIPGSRLIPYHVIGKSGGMLPAVRIDEITIGHHTCSALVAFSSDRLGEDFSLLAGGEWL